VDPPLPQEVQAAMSMEDKPAVKTEVVKPKAIPKAKAKVAKKQSPSQFNTSLKSINERISKLEKGQKELFTQLANTDKKLDNLITRFDGVSAEGKASKTTPSAAPVVGKEKVESPPPTSLKNEIKKEEATPQKVEKVKEIKKEEIAATPQKMEKMEKVKEVEIKGDAKKEEVQPQKMDKAEVKKDKAPETSPVVAAAVQPTNDVSTTISNINKTEAEPTPVPAVVAPQVAPAGEVKMEEKKPMAKKPIVVSEPVEEEKDVGEQFMGYLSEHPLEAGGFLAALVALVSVPVVLSRRRAKKAVVASDFTMQP
jgi:hypothetical protein